jgi:hypothetical protein
MMMTRKEMMVRGLRRKKKKKISLQGKRRATTSPTRAWSGTGGAGIKKA